MADTNKLQLYNEALSHLQEVKLASLGEARPSRRALDLHYASALKYVSEGGFWKKYSRTVQITADPDIAPAFDTGRYPFNKPEDLIKVYQMSASDTLDPPLLGWIEEANLFWAFETVIYCRYISNDETEGFYNVDSWPGRIQLAFTTELAYRIQPLLPGSKADKDDLKAAKDEALLEALSQEAMREPPKRPPEGMWNRGRFRGRSINESRA